MTGYTVCTAVLLVGGLFPGMVVAWRGNAVDRLIGLEIVCAVTVVAMLLIAQVVNQTYDLIVPVVLAPMSAAGTLVFTRLVQRPDDGS